MNQRIRVSRSSCSVKLIPPTSRHLWHLFFWPLEQKLKTFLESGLWLARLDTFAEASESQLPHANLGLLVKAGTPLIPWIQAQYQMEARSAYASCWHMSEADPSAYAWEQFGLNGRGVAIRTTPEAMWSALRPVSGPDGPVYFGAIEYIDHDTSTIQPENVIAAALAVDKKYQQEMEARVLIHTEGGAAAERLLDYEGPYGALITRNPNAGQPGEPTFVGGARESDGKAIVISIEPQEFIHEIILGPGLSEETRRALLAMIRNHGMASKLRR